MVNLKDLKKGAYIVWENQPYIVKDISFDISNANVEILGLFSNKINVISIPLTEHLTEIQLTRKCASIISKKKDKLEIIDAVTFDSFDADISPELLEQADENDQVTYIQFNNIARIIELRKR